MNVYTGIVINNTDPNHIGEAQVYVIGKDIPISSMDKNISHTLFISNDRNDGDLTPEIVNFLRKTCSWASICQPIFGGSNSVRTDLKIGKATTSMSATNTDDFAYTDTNHGAKAPGFRFSEFGARVDAFADPGLTLTRNCNYAGLDYFPQNYINAPNGSFSIPEINSYVYVAYRGNSKNPVIIGAAPRLRDIDLILMLK